MNKWQFSFSCREREIGIQTASDEKGHETMDDIYRTVRRWCDAVHLIVYLDAVSNGVRIDHVFDLYADAHRANAFYLATMSSTISYVYHIGLSLVVV